MLTRYAPVGYMPMPPDFKHQDILAAGRPVHHRDSFFAKHPPMKLSRRAKLFSPFDALAGFDDAIASKDVLYVDKRELTTEEKEDLDKKLDILEGLTRNGPLARRNRPQVKVWYYVPCTDPQSFSYQIQGRYLPLSGTCLRVDRVNETIQVDKQVLPLSDVWRIENEALFPQLWESA